MAVTKILDIDGVKTLWEKIKGMFATKNDLNNYIPKYGGGNMIQVHQIIGGVTDGVHPNENGDKNLILGDAYETYLKYGTYEPEFSTRSGIIVKTDENGNGSNSVTILTTDAYTSAQNIRLSSTRDSVVNGHDAWILPYEGTFPQIGIGSFDEATVNGGLHVDNKNECNLASQDSKLCLNQKTNSRKSYIVTKTGFAMGMVTDLTLIGTAENPGQNSGTCAFYFDKSKTLIGCSDTAATRNVVEIQKGTVRMRANGTSLLKASTDTSYARLASKTGCVAAYQNLYVVNPDNNVAGLKVETDANGNVITTIGDKTQNTVEILRIEYGGHTYSLDLVKLEDDGYLTQID